MEHFITLFDKNFVLQGLALHLSMERHINEYVLWILCMDVETFELLNKLKLKNVNCLSISDYEDINLLSIKNKRTKSEYCWTVTPIAPRIVFEKDSSIERVTYLDADVWFLNNPKPIFDDFDKSGKHILITRHDYSPYYDLSKLSGNYCVQFLIFTRHGEFVRNIWQNQCLEWCFAKHENGLFGDQKYLDKWTEDYQEATHVLSIQGSILAPWNATRFPLSEAICYHFHGLRVGKYIQLSDGYELPVSLLKHVYVPYIEELRCIRFDLKKYGFTPRAQKQRIINRILFFRNLINIYKNIIINIKYSFIKF